MGHQEDVKRHRRRLRIWVDAIKSEKGCSECGYNHPAALSYHHTGEKNHEISTMVRKGRGRKAILEEMELCIVLCRNCHAEQHAPRVRW